MSKLVASVLQVTGFGFVALAGFTVDPAAGFAALGAGLFAFGVALERDV